jgi:hypothetical protein
VIQTTGAGQASWVSAADMMNLLALVLTTFGEFTVLTFSLWLLFRPAALCTGYDRRGLAMLRARRSLSRDLMHLKSGLQRRTTFPSAEYPHAADDE